MIAIDTSQLETVKEQQNIYEVVYRYFALFASEKKDLLKSLMVLLAQKQPILIKAGQYEMLLNVEEKIAISADFVHVMQYFIDSHINTKINLQFECRPIDFFDYHLLQQKLKQHDAIEYPLTSLMWQLYHQILPRNVVAHDTRWLRLKITKFPDFNSIGVVPQYISDVLKHCMQEGKTIAELNADFPSVTAMKLHRLFLLCVLTGVADIEVLYASHQYNQEMLSKTNCFGAIEEGAGNTAINSNNYLGTTNDANTNQIGKSGLFGRLLQVKDFCSRRRS